MKWPSCNDENPLTWKCKLFGCRDEYLPLTYYKEDEKHGVKAWCGATASRTLTAASYKGCIWCMNYQEILDPEELIGCGFYCDCAICVEIDPHGNIETILGVNK